ncbi:MAG: hypothetical protein B6D44_12880 [Ignavibacteriales bacterium UTCHB2]|nr:MAG: hypothetical protein B6D44_12880 [Ignavibacteriales bacterium UTCHB2]
MYKIKILKNMKEKLKSLGRILSKEEQKVIIGGMINPEGTCGANCDQTCTVICNGQTVSGTCSNNNPSKKCYCSGGC